MFCRFFAVNILILYWVDSRNWRQFVELACRSSSANFSCAGYSRYRCRFFSVWTTSWASAVEINLPPFAGLVQPSPSLFLASCDASRSQLRQRQQADASQRVVNSELHPFSGILAFCGRIVPPICCRPDAPSVPTVNLFARRTCHRKNRRDKHANSGW